MQPQPASKNFDGICIFPDAFQIKNFDSQTYDPEEWYPFVLSNGRMIDKGGEVLKQISFDFNGGETFYNGYIKGFIYSNGKFLGRMHYVPTVNRPPESLDGTYNFVDSGIEMKGIWYAGNERWGFFIRLKETATIQERKKLPSPKKKIASKVRKVARQPETYKEVLTKDLIETIIKKAAPIKAKSRATKFDHYQHVIDLRPKPKDFDSVVMAMSIAYSWMPTMLDIYINDVKNKKRILKAVQNLGTIKSLEDFEKQKNNIAAWLTDLVDVVNHSIVGVSKTLHIFFPKNIPIIDSRVLKTWNDLFKSKFKKNKELKLPLHLPLTSQSMVNTYMQYWKCLLYWAHNTRVNDLRKIEESLYWLGGKKGK
jgi:hypothetical protein